MNLGGLCPAPWPLGRDLTAPEHARICADVVAVSRTLPFAVMRVFIVGGVSATVTDYIGQNGVGLDYAPTGSVSGTGDFTLTWEPSYVDGYDIAEPIALRHGKITSQQTASVDGVVEILTRSSCRVRTFNTASGAAANSHCYVVVW
jgi:hypothetical protein